MDDEKDSILLFFLLFIIILFINIVYFQSVF
jgi:hypothetical protein